MTDTVSNDDFCSWFTTTFENQNFTSMQSVSKESTQVFWSTVVPPQLLYNHTAQPQLFSSTGVPKAWSILYALGIRSHIPRGNEKH